MNNQYVFKALDINLFNSMGDAIDCFITKMDTETDTEGLIEVELVINHISVTDIDFNQALNALTGGK
jgi:hypothetical protein